MLIFFKHPQKPNSISYNLIESHLIFIQYFLIIDLFNLNHFMQHLINLLQYSVPFVSSKFIHSIILFFTFIIDQFKEKLIKVI